jgi:hypothetical protein
MEKFGTYEIYKNIKTGEIKKVEPGTPTPPKELWVRDEEAEIKTAELIKEGK